MDTDRGGKITWHGPDQLVGYPIIGLAEPLDVVDSVRRLRGIVDQGMRRRQGWQQAESTARPGSGCRAEKERPRARSPPSACRVSRATTGHGFALSCDCDLNAFTNFVPCGISDAGADVASVG